MEFPRTRVQLLVIVGALFLVACVSPENSTIDTNALRPNVNTNFNSNAANANANTTQDDERELDKIVNLPFTPEETVWRKDKIAADTNDNRVPGPVDYKLTAVMKFKESDVEALVLKAKEKTPPRAIDLEPETWFPAELIAKTQTSGKSTIEGLSYSAEGFMKPPYSVGSLIHIKDTDYFVLKLQTK